MKIIKTAIILLIILFLLSILFYFLPTEELLSRLPFVKDLYNNTSITINSKNGKAVVTVNGKDYGETPVTISNLAQGEFEITMTKVSEVKDFYSPKNIDFFLERGTEAIIDYEIGPDGIDSGYLLYYTKSSSSSSDSGFMTLTTTPEKADLYLDGEYFQKAPISTTSLNAKNYQITTKAQGHEDLTLPIIIRNGYNLNISISLYPIPTTLIK